MDQEARRITVGVEQIPNRRSQPQHNDDPQDCSHASIDLRRCLNTIAVQRGEEHSKHAYIHEIRHLWYEIDCGPAAPYRTDQWIENIIHDHTPAGKIAQARVNLLANV